MKTKLVHNVKRTSWFLDQFMPYVLLVAIVVFGLAIINFQKDNQRLLENQQVTIEKQNQTLEAIKQLSVDNKLTSKQLGDTIICMLQVPITQRTPDIKENCIKQATQATQTESQAQQAKTIADNPQIPVAANNDKQNNQNITTPETQKTLVENMLDNIQRGLENIVDRGLLR